MIDSKDLPIFVKIAEQLRQQISQKGYAPGAFLPREIELAKQFDISRATLRNAMAILEKDGWIIRKKRLGTIVAPDALRRKYRKIDIGFFVRCSLTDYQEYVEIFQAQLHLGYTLRRAVKRRYFVRLFPWFNPISGETPYDLNEILMHKGVDAFVLASPAYLGDVIDKLRENHIPHVALETHINRPGVNSVVLDDEKSIAFLMRKLYELGHRKIGFLGGLLKHVDLNSHCRRALTEFMKQVNCFGINVKDHWIQCTGADEWSNRTVSLGGMVKEMFSGNDVPTAVVAINAQAVNVCINTLKSMGFRVPEDVSVVTPAILNCHENSHQVSGFYYDLDEYADMVLDEIVMNLRNASYRPGKHIMYGAFQEGETMGLVPDFQRKKTLKSNTKTTN
ncbi:MAG: GntR family transcriptional regulator [Lentisphaeria bacterium]|nr:GntR family transcriptional regulator [Lentisphaeria bacterium]